MKILGIIIAVVIVSFLGYFYVTKAPVITTTTTITENPFGQPDSLSSTNPNCGERKLKMEVKLDSKKDFVDFLKNTISDVSLDDYKNASGDIDWNKVLINTETQVVGTRTVYSLVYRPKNCSDYKLKMTNDGYTSIYGCCGK